MLLNGVVGILGGALLDHFMDVCFFGDFGRHVAVGTFFLLYSIVGQAKNAKVATPKCPGSILQNFAETLRDPGGFPDSGNLGGILIGFGKMQWDGIWVISTRILVNSTGIPLIPTRIPVNPTRIPVNPTGILVNPTGIPINPSESRLIQPES